MGPEGPWQRLAAALRGTDGGLFQITFILPQTSLRGHNGVP